MATQSLLPVDGTFSVDLITSRTTTGAGDTFSNLRATPRTFQASIAGTGAITAEVFLQVSNDGTNFATMITFTLSGTGSDSAFAAVPAAKWPYMRAYVNSISGTGAAVTVTVGG